MEPNIVSAIISSIVAIGLAGLGVVQYKAQKTCEKKEAEREEREALRGEGALIQMEMSQASLKLAQVTAKAVMNQHLNGDVEEAMDWAQKVEIKYNQYLRKISQML